MIEIAYQNDNLGYRLNKDEIEKVVSKIITDHSFFIEELTIIFTDRAFHHEMNLNYLNHDTDTDVITFDLSETEKTVSGEIYINTDMALENAEKIGMTHEEELCNLVIHGVLHLLGYDDKISDLQKEMFKKQAKYLKNVSRETLKIKG